MITEWWEYLLIFFGILFIVNWAINILTDEGVRTALYKIIHGKEPADEHEE